MNKKAEKIINSHLLTAITTKSKVAMDEALNKITLFADIMDQAGHEKVADTLDDFVKQAGFWSSFFSGLVGGGGAGLWDALKSGKIKESLGDIVKKALMGAGTGVIVEYVIKGLDEVPLIGPYLKELVGADKLRSMLEGVIAGAVAESGIVNKLVDKTIEAIEGFFTSTMGKTQEHKAPTINVEPTKPSTDTAQFPVNVPGAKA